MRFARKLPLAALAAAALAALPLLGAGCIYAPLDFGLGEIGKVQEVTLVESEARAKVLMLHIDGEINDEASGGGLFGTTEGTTAQVKDVLDLARKDDSVVALLLRINTPGGGVTASDIIYREISAWKAETKKPVVALMMDTCASGGYYVSMAADRIVAHPTCITGSIGVITMLPNVAGLADKLGVEVVTIKSGSHKDMGSPFRAPTDEDRKLFQSLIDQMYGRFVDVVAAGRKGLAKDRIRQLADGRVYTAPEALQNKLIDQIGYFEDALAAAKKLANVRDARVVSYERKGLGSGRRTIYSSSFAEPVEASLLARGGAEGDRNIVKIDARPLLPGASGPVFKYLWLPTIH
ncbi:MAG TPA: signal peptide peptidase SppA [Planctomycetota bacterium]|nr:signal peptide peptidase SppA [Planctomycetota bacterium]